MKPNEMESGLRNKGGPGGEDLLVYPRLALGPIWPDSVDSKRSLSGICIGGEGGAIHLGAFTASNVFGLGAVYAGGAKMEIGSSRSL